MSSETRRLMSPLKDSTHARNRITRSSGPSKPLLWVGYQQDSLLNAKLAGEKQAFLKRQLFRSKKARLQNLSPTKLFPVEPEEEHDTPTLCPSLEIGVLDTFPSLSGLTRKNVNTYFLFFKDSIAPSGQPFSANKMTLWYYQKSVDQPVVIESLATIGAVSMAIQPMNGLTSREVHDYHQDSLQLQARALRSLRAIVERPSNGSLQMAILSIGLLIYVGGYFEKGRGILQHLNGLKRIVHTLGGYDKVDHLTLSEIYCCELTASLMSNFQLPFEMDPGWQKKVEEDFNLLMTKSLLPKSSRVGNRFFTSSWSPDLPRNFRSIIIAIRYLILDFETLGEANPRDSPIKNDRLTLCARQLIGLPSSCPITPFQNILRLSILLYCVVRIWSIPSKPWIDMITGHLFPLLKTEFVTLERTAPDSLFWILFVFSLETRGLEHNAWFVTRLVKMARLLHLQDWESVLPRLEGFFFIPRSINDPARLFWSSEIQPGLIHPI